MNPPEVAHFASPGFNGVNVYRASGIDEPRIRLVSSPSTLTLGAIKVDEIALLGSVYVKFQDGDFSLDASGNRFHAGERAAAYSWREEVRRLALQGVKDPYPFKPDQSISEAIWRTLIGDITPTMRPAPTIFGSDYQNWIELLNYWKLYSSSSDLGTFFLDESCWDR